MATKLIVICVFIVLLFGLYFYYSYKVIDKDKSDNYYFNSLKTQVHYVPMGNRFELGDFKIDGVDIKTIKVLGKYYIKDKSHVYFKYTKINNADANTFKLICANNAFYAKDKNTVYYQGNSFKGIDVNSIKFISEDCGYVLTDKNHVYSVYSMEHGMEGNLTIAPIENTTSEKYQYLNDFYGKDDKTAFYEGHTIVGSDAATFVALGDYAKDRHRVYCNGLQVVDVDPQTFGLVDGGSYTKDKNNVYLGLNSVDDENGNTLHYVGRVVEGADPKTFTMIKGEKIDYAKDKSRFYWGGKAQPE